ncbi:Uncharacterised protein [Amycolatopsis camponoti]|uniref:Uncharacterized protein n=1 Tax=Amycolatopsis camponoti TaxID=2606593 RepID=A0A6I8M0F2_9PSEU|nr:tetratricopeptide repeat protein [Amycolatopsis camponoti]VVJ22868.1 Uncharacterised protein [Amycolatopsis camponoti]
MALTDALDTLVERIARHRRRGELRDGEELAHQALDAHPATTDAMLALGRILFEGYRYREADEQFLRAGDFAPDDPRPAAWRIALLASRWQYSEACAVASAALARHPTDPQIRIALGRLHLDRGQVREGLAVLHEAITVAPDDRHALGWYLNGLATDRQFAAVAERAGKFDDLHGHLAGAQYQLGCALLSSAPAKALSCFTRAVELDPGDPRHHEWRVTALRRLNRYEEAQTRVAEAIEEFPAFPKLRVEKAMLASDLKRYDDALTAIGEALEILPRHRWALRRKVDVLADAHRYDEAEEATRQAFEHWPGDPEIHVSLAWARHARMRYDDALAAADQALAIEPHDIWAHSVRITILRDAGRFDKAEEAVAEALAVHPDEPQILTAHAWLRREQDDLPGALAMTDKAVRGELPDSWALRSRVSLLQSARRYEDAEKAALEALALRPHDLGLHREYVWLLCRRDREDEAVAAAQNTARANPMSVNAQRTLVEMLRLARRYPEAEAAVAEALERHPASVELHLEKAWLASSQDDEEAAIFATERALLIDPASPDALEARASFLNYANRFAEAEEAANAALRRDAGTAAIYLQLGNALFYQGRTADGVEAIRAGLSRFQGDLALLRDLVSLLRQTHRYDESFAAAEAALVKYPDDAYLLTELAWNFSERNKAKEALATIERALDATPSSTWALRSRVRFLSDLKKYDEATEALEAAQAQLPDLPDLVTEQGWLLHQQRRYEEADEAGRRAVRIAPLNEWALRSLVTFVSSARSLAEAEAEARRAIALMPHSPGLRTDLAWLVSRQNREEEAVGLIDEVLAAHPHNVSALSARISFLGFARRFEEQQEALAHALKLHPDDVDILLATASVHSDYDRHEQAIALVDHAIELSPGDLRPLRHRVGTLIAARRLGDAEHACELLPDEDDGEVLLLRARIARLRDKHQTAVDLLARAGEADPSHLGVRAQQVNALLPLQRLAEAEAIARQAMDEYPGEATAALALSRVLEHRRDIAGALTCLEPALSRDPDAVSLWLARSRLLRSARRFPEAEREVDRLVRELPHDWDLRLELGWIQHDCRRLDEANRTFTALLATAADNGERATALHGRGWTEFAGENFAAAEKDFQSALAHRPNEFDDQLGLAWSLARQADAAKQRQALEVAADLDRRLSDPSVHVCLGVLAFKAGQPAAAEHHFRRALEISPNHGSHTDLGALYAHLGRSEEAESELRAAIDQDWHDAVAHVELGSLLLDLGGDRLAEAEREFRQALAADRASTEAAIGLAQTLTKAGEEPEAEATLRNALKHQAGRRKWQTHLALARLLVQRGDKQQSSDLHAEAYAEAQMAIGLAPDHEPEPHFVAGVAHHRMGSLSADARGRFGYRQRAMNHLRECLERTPGHADAQRNKLLLEREMRATAPAIWGGYAVATISVVLLGVEWVTFYLTDKVTVLLLTTTTPVLVGLFTIAVLLPALIKLKLPGFEADLQAGTASITPGPTGQVPFSSRFSITTGPTGQLPRHGASSPTRPD